MFAGLIDKFGLRPWEIARLTDRQIRELYFHPRDKEGNIQFPGSEDITHLDGNEMPLATLESDLAALDAMKGDLRPDWYDSAVREVRKAYANRNLDKPRPGSGDD